MPEQSSGLCLFGQRVLGRVQTPLPPLVDNPSPPLEFTPGLPPHTLDSRHPGSMLSLTALFHEAYGDGPAGVPRLAKLVKFGANPDEVENYQGATFFDATGLYFSTFERALNALQYLQEQRSTCLVYGALTGDANPRSMCKLIYDTPGKKDPKKIWKATLMDKPSAWLFIDIDKLEVPREIHGLREQAVFAGGSAAGRDSTALAASSRRRAPTASAAAPACA